MKLEGKVAIITGAGSGIGRVASLLFAQEGARMAIADKNKEAADETVVQIVAAGGEAIAVQVDVTITAEICAMVERVMQGFGQIDILYNHAGINRRASLVDLEEDDWNAVIATNLKSIYLGCKYVLPHMIARRRGAIINTGGTFSFYGAPEIPAYAAAKGGVLNLTKQIALDYAPYGIRVNCVCPGFIDTPMNAQIPTTQWQEIVKTQPIGRAGRAEEVAKAALFLASDDASFTTGTSLLVDGGQLCGRHGV